MPVTIAIIGAGGFGRETFDLIRSGDPLSDNWRIAGFVDSSADPSLLTGMGAEWLGDDATFLSAPCADMVLVAVGDPQVRASIVLRYRDAGATFATFIHPSAHVGSAVAIGEGSIVSAGAMVMNSTRLGAFSNIDRRSMVGHDSSLADYATLHPASVVSGRVAIGASTRLGSCSCVLPGVVVGANVVVGAGAVVTTTVADGSTVVGVPARPLTPR